MKRRIIVYGLSLVLLVAPIGCTSLLWFAPKSFIKTIEPSWASMEIRADVPYDKAWSSVVDLLVKRFDLEKLEKDDGYIRTGWLYTWTGKMKDNYRVRVTTKFSENKNKVEIKSEAHYGGPGKWVVGSDTRLLSTLKTDIMGSIGRTTR